MSLVKNYFLTVILLIFCLLISSCRSNYRTTAFSNQQSPSKPDYKKESSWAVLPSKIPPKLKVLVPDLKENLEADVFYLYPTLITDKKDLRWNVAINDQEQNDKVINTAVFYQASAWAAAGNLYVPFYRQAHIRSYSLLDKGGEQALLLAYKDIRSAFEIYLEKYNNSRPIIIAGHSQGATHGILLLKEFFDNKPLQKQLVAAYLPGIGIKEQDFISLKPMTSPDQIGGYLSWNTFKQNKLPKKYDHWYKGSVTSNPINWDGSKSTLREEHQGFLYTNKKVYDQALNLELIDGMVWTSLPRFPLRIFALFKKNYHVGDVNLFWKDIQINAKQRVRSWLKNNEHLLQTN